MFFYTSGASYEKGDFVINRDRIYICTKDITVVPDNITPNPENFTTYLGGDSASWEDFEKIYSNQSNLGEDKLITSAVLSKILKRLMFGIDSSGIIDEGVFIDNNNQQKLSSGLNNLNRDDVFSKYQNILDSFLLIDSIPEFNNLSLRVSRSLLEGLLPPVDNISSYGSIEKTSVILRQYTYYEVLGESFNNKVRVQEVIDHINGVCLYRFVRFSNSSDTVLDEENIGLPSSWKISCPNIEYLSKIDSLLKYVEDEKSKNENKNKDKFYFKKLSLVESVSNNNVNEISYAINYSGDIDTALENVTITIFSRNQNSDTNLKNSYSMTVNLSNSEVGIYYAFPNGVKIVRDNNIDLLTRPTIRLIIPDSIDTAYISSAYIRCCN